MKAVTPEIFPSSSIIGINLLFSIGFELSPEDEVDSMNFYVKIRLINFIGFILKILFSLSIILFF